MAQKRYRIVSAAIFLVIAALGVGVALLGGSWAPFRWSRPPDQAENKEAVGGSGTGSTGNRPPAGLALAQPRAVPEATGETVALTKQAGDAQATLPGLLVPGPQPPADGSEPEPDDLFVAPSPQRVPLARSQAQSRMPRPQPPPGVRARNPNDELAASANQLAQPQALPSGTDNAQPAKPRFDVVRVDPEGRAVIAGQAPPGAEISLYSQAGESLGRTTANSNGEFVVVPERPLSSGAHEFTLRARTQDGETRFSEKGVLAVIPKPRTPLTVPQVQASLPVPKASASRPQATDAPGGKSSMPTRQKPLVMLVPRDPKAVSEIVQQPGVGKRGAHRSLQTSRSATGPEGDLARAPLRVPKAGTPPGPAKVPSGPKSPDKSVTVEVIEYGERTPLAVRGKAPPGAELRAYIGERKLGKTKAGSDGRWRVLAPRPVPPGKHKLRVERLDPTGNIAARLVMFFERARAPSPDTQGDFVIVQPGHSLWRIARRIYGSGIRYTQIYRANREQIGDPDLIYPGQVFRLPDVQGKQPETAAKSSSGEG